MVVSRVDNINRRIENRLKMSSGKLMTQRIVGIDLAGTPDNKTGLAILRVRVEGLHVETRVLHGDNEILYEAAARAPALVAIDAPLTYPKGRCCFERDCGCSQRGKNIRVAERRLMKRGIRVFPCSFGGMKKLTARGVWLSSSLRGRGLKVIEIYPGSAQDILGIPRKNQGKGVLQEGLVGLGLKGDVAERELSHDELDAVTAAYTAYMHLCGKTEEIGDPVEGTIVVPSLGSTEQTTLASSLPP